MQSKRIAQLVKEACEDKKAEDVVILDVHSLANFTHYFVIATGTSDRHVQAIAHHVSDFLRKKVYGNGIWKVFEKENGLWWTMVMSLFMCFLKLNVTITV